MPFSAAVPGEHAFNLRSLYLLNTNYRISLFLFTLHCGEPVIAIFGRNISAVLETNHYTPYFLNLHITCDVAHTMILGRTGAGKSFLLNFLITNLQKYDPHTFIFDLRFSFESLSFFSAARMFASAPLNPGISKSTCLCCHRLRSTPPHPPPPAPC